MKRPLRPDEARLWGLVAATVRPAAGRKPAPPPAIPGGAADPGAGPAHAGPDPGSTLHAAHPRAAQRPGPGRDGGAKGSLQAPNPPRPLPSVPEGIEPNRRRRIARGRDDLFARLDLHGYDQDRARARLLAFLQGAQAQGGRAVLVITGKGFAGEGVLRRRAPEWLADPALRSVVAGLSPADDRHGGAGAWYVALKRRPR